MENLSVSSNNLNFVDNSTINFTGLCTPNTFDISERTFSEEVINDSIILPSAKTPIKQINDIDVKNAILNYKVIESPGNTSSLFVANYENKRITGKKVSVFGVICLDITYTGEDPTGANQKFSGKLPFTSYIVLPKTIVLTDKFDISCCVQKINIVSIGNSSILNVSANITVSAKRNRDPIPVIGQPSACSCSGSNSLVAIGTTPGNKLKNLITTQDKTWNEISFSRNLILPKNLPNAKSVTSISSSVKVISQKIIEIPEVQPNATNLYGQAILGKKLTIEVMLKQRITYVADNEKTSNHSLIINTPVSCYIILPKATDLSQRFNIDSYIEDLHSCAINERTLFTGAMLFFKAREENCTPINISKGYCSYNLSSCFDIQYNVKDICNLRAIPSLVNRTFWGETTVSKRIEASENAPIDFIKSASASLKTISINIVQTANSRTQFSHEGFLLSGIIAVIEGCLVTNITYNSKNSNHSVISKNITIPFSTFIVISEEPTATSKLLLTASCIENFCVAVLDENGIGVFAQLFFNARIVSKTT